MKCVITNNIEHVSIEKVEVENFYYNGEIDDKRKKTREAAGFVETILEEAGNNV